MPRFSRARPRRRPAELTSAWQRSMPETASDLQAHPAGNRPEAKRVLNNSIASWPPLPFLKGRGLRSGGYQAPVELRLSTLTLPSPLGRERRILSAFRGALARKGRPSRIFIRGYSFD